MAKQKGIVKFQGALDDITFYKHKTDTLLKRKAVYLPMHCIGPGFRTDKGKR